MFFFNTILCFDILSPVLSPSDVSNIQSIKVSNAYIEKLRITKDTNYSLTTTIPTAWDKDTIMNADYNGTLAAGNVDFQLDKIKGGYLLIKRRIRNSMKWITLQAYPVESEDDLFVSFIDQTAAPGLEYEYAAVPYKEGTVYGNYSSSITPETDRLVIVDRTALWATIVTDGFCNSQRNSPPGVVEPINSKYPVIIHNGMANYDTVTVTAGWFPTDDDGCSILVGEEYSAWVARYAKQFMDFLTNKKVRLLKNVDGRTWLGYTTTLPSNNARDVYWDREITFGLTEIADVEDERALYDAGLIDAPEEFWNS